MIPGQAKNLKNQDVKDRERQDMHDIDQQKLIEDVRTLFKS
jgi:hypothetical protein